MKSSDAVEANAGLGELSDPPPPNVYEIGLVMAGAVSAGCYTAGVLDFLFEALDAYCAAKKQPDWTGPTHEVRVRIVTGASAGGISSVLFAAALNREFRHYRASGDTPNPMFQLWVDDISIWDLLATDDISSSGPLNALLNGGGLEAAAKATLSRFGDTPIVARREWIDDPLPVFLTVTNLRGLPYAFGFQNADDPVRYGMTNHADLLRFAAMTTRPQGKTGDLHVSGMAGHVALDARDPNPEKPGWGRAVMAGLATSAFPIGLPARTVDRQVSEYRVQPGDPTALPEPSFEDGVWTKDPYAFEAVDGGVIDNEPLERARRFLAAGLKRNDRSPDARRSVVLIDPFPNELEDDSGHRSAGSIVEVAKRLVRALVNQSRFKPEELQLANDEHVYSRFAILPSRTLGEEKRAPALACGQMGGFSGFFARAYREHDYLLGRRNCQSFLALHFAVPRTNPLFDGKPGIDMAEWRVSDPRDQAAGGVEFLPIIPLTGDLKMRLPAPVPPPAGLGAIPIDKLRSAVENRARAALPALAKELPFIDKIPKFLLRIFGTVAARKIQSVLETELKRWKP